MAEGGAESAPAPNVPAAAGAAVSGSDPAAAPASAEEVKAKKDATGGQKRPAPGERKGDLKRQRADFTVGDRGVFFTTVTPGSTGNARRDLIRLLEEALPADEAAVAKVDGDGSATAGSALEAELQQLREAKPTFLCCSHEVAKGTGFLKFTGSASSTAPSEVVMTLLERQRAAYLATRMAPSSRLLCRVLPIDHTCKPHLDSFKALAQDVLPKHVGLEAEPTVWALEFRARNTSTMKKEAVLEVIDAIVPKGRHKVNLSDPEKCILVEANPLFCGLSVLKKWGPLRKYNMHALTTPDEPRKPAAPPKACVAAAPGSAEAAVTGVTSPAKADMPPSAAAAPASTADGQAAAAGASRSSAAPAAPASPPDQ